jgi:hypothetical protein
MLIKLCTLNTDLDEQGSWASVARRFRNMDVQASRRGHRVQTKDVGGVLWKQENRI